MTRNGHLSNDAAAEVAGQIVTAELRQLFLGHLSRDCNRPELAHRAVSQLLQQVGAHHVRVACAAQDIPCPTVALESISIPLPVGELFPRES